jgi:hypothetical protein
MKASIRPLRWVGRVAALMFTLPLLAFPPAPHHEVFGVVRDEQGNPINAAKAAVLLEVGGTLVAQASISSGLDLGVNYRLTIPLDAGVTADKYKPTAMLPTVPFRLRVKIGNVSYLPIEMTGASTLVTQPGGSSRVDLTLGEDSDGDGIPDAWERNVIAATGGGKSLADINPGDDADGDGLSNLQEYLAGTYAFDPADGFALAIRSVDAGRPLLEFTAIRGRSYTIHGSADMQSWTAVPFRLGSDAATGVTREVYVSNDVRPIRALTGPFAEGEATPRFFKLIVH